MTEAAQLGPATHAAATAAATDGGTRRSITDATDAEGEDYEGGRPAHKVVVVEGANGSRTVSPAITAAPSSPTNPGHPPGGGSSEGAPLTSSTLSFTAAASDAALGAIDPVPLWPGLEGGGGCHLNEGPSWADYPEEWWQALESPSSTGGPDPELEKSNSCVCKVPSATASSALALSATSATATATDTARMQSSTKKRARSHPAASTADFSTSEGAAVVIRLSGHPPDPLRDIVFSADPSRHAAISKAYPATATFHNLLGPELLRRYAAAKSTYKRRALLRKSVVDPLVESDPNVRFVREVLVPAPEDACHRPRGSDEEEEDDDAVRRDRHGERCDDDDPPVGRIDAANATFAPQDEEASATATATAAADVQWKSLTLREATDATLELVKHLASPSAPPPLVLSGSNEVRLSQLSRLHKEDVSQALDIINLPPFTTRKRGPVTGGTHHPTAAKLLPIFRPVSDSSVMTWNGGYRPLPSAAMPPAMQFEPHKYPVRVTPDSLLDEEEAPSSSPRIAIIQSAPSLCLGDCQSPAIYCSGTGTGGAVAASHSTIDPSDLVDLNRSLSGLALFHHVADEGASLAAVDRLLDDSFVSGGCDDGENDNDSCGNEAAVPDKNGVVVAERMPVTSAAVPDLEGLGRSDGLPLRPILSADPRRLRSSSGDGSSCGTQRWRGDDS